MTHLALRPIRASAYIWGLAIAAAGGSGYALNLYLQDAIAAILLIVILTAAIIGLSHAIFTQK